jgi:hypothetical protein
MTPCDGWNDPTLPENGTECRGFRLAMPLRALPWLTSTRRISISLGKKSTVPISGFSTGFRHAFQPNFIPGLKISPVPFLAHPAGVA